MRVFFAEYLSGLTDEPLDAGLLAQGLAMRDAVLADLAACAARDAALSVACAVTKQAPLPAGMEGVRRLPVVWERWGVRGVPRGTVEQEGGRRRGREGASSGR